LATVVPNAQVFIVGIYAALTGERTPGRAIAAIPFAFLGLALLARLIDPFSGALSVSAGSNPALGVVWGLGAASFYGLYLVITRRISSGSSAVGPFGMLRDAAIGTILVSGLIAAAGGTRLQFQDGGEDAVGLRRAEINLGVGVQAEFKGCL
jgi:drug/metabolite transporter (DMT)-like permease